MGFFSKLFAKDRVKISERKAKGLASQGRHTEAAQVFSTAAVEEMPANELISVDYYHDAFTEYVKAQDPKSAIEQARKALAVMSADDGSWIKYDSGGETEDLTAMARELFDAGYKRAARVVAKEVNDQFTKYGLSIRVVLPKRPSGSSFPRYVRSAARPFPRTKQPMKCSAPFAHA